MPVTSSHSQRPELPGYKVGELIGTGGMGRVYAGLELMLGREVAIKTLLPEANPERFVNEAALTSRLTHPGIPPVYALGTATDGSPFLVMKLIRGRTLAELLKSRSDPSQELPRYLQIFEQITQAMAFAHTRGVIHRDLKPSNVMVGEFGEVQVMDWGLARLVNQDEQAEQTELFTPKAEFPPLPLTIEGTILGTPGYMPPEQARGEPLTTAADVFALGAILTEILTGRPAFTGDSTWEIMFRTTSGDLADALERLDGCKADPELVALAGRYLAENPDQRAPHAGRVAADLATYRANMEERLRRAETDAHEARIRAGERRKRLRVLVSAVVTIAVVLVLGVIGTVVGLFRAIEAAEAEKKARKDVEIKKAQVDGALSIAAERTRLALSAFDEVVDQIDSRLEDVPNQQAVRRALLGQARDGLQKMLDDARKVGRPDETLIRIHGRLGNIAMSLLDWPVAEGHFRTAIETVDQLNSGGPEVISGDELAALNNRQGDCLIVLKRSAEALESYERATQIRLKLLDRDPKNLVARRNVAVMFGRMGEVALQTGDTERAQKQLSRTRKELNELLVEDSRNPEFRRNLCNCLLRLGAIESAAGRFDSAIMLLSEAKANALFLTFGHPRTTIHFLLLSECNLLLGQAEEEREQRAAASDLYRQARMAAEVHLSKESKNPAGRLSIVESLWGFYRVDVLRGREQEAAAHLKDVLARTAQLRVELGNNPHQLARLNSLMFDASEFALRRGQFATAEAMLRDLLTIHETKEPDSWTTFNTCSRLGVALAGQKKYAEAQPLLLKGYEGLKAREKTIPEKMRTERITATLDALVKLYEAIKKPDEARKYRELLDMSGQGQR